MKQWIPLPVRNLLRPSFQMVRRKWDESLLKPRAADWHARRQELKKCGEFGRMLTLVGEDFGITQVRSEIEGLVGAVRSINPKIVVEIGTHKGGNSALFCRTLETAEHIVGLDLCVQNAAKVRFFAAPEKRYTVIHGDSQVPEARKRLERALGGRPIDFLFIDGDHSYDGVRRDYELYSPLVRKGGVIAFHDIIPDHRARFGKETGCYAGGVHQLWSELKAEGGRTDEFVGDYDQDGFGIGVLWR